MNQKWEEIILAAPRSEVFDNEWLTFQGTLTDTSAVNHIMERLASSIISIRRGNEQDSTPKENNAEINTDYLQPIPYAIIRRNGSIFVYRRLGGGGEARLHDKLSIGAGGHMNPIEGEEDFAKVLEINLARELEEELDIEDKNMRITPVGLINDDSNDVSKVHIGVLVIIDVAFGTDVYVRETEQLEGFCLLMN
jgi:predicted NUDIX family phosphoesterase